MRFIYLEQVWSITRQILLELSGSASSGWSLHEILWHMRLHIKKESKIENLKYVSKLERGIQAVSVNDLTMIIS